MKVRQYVADGPGAVKIQTVSDYPRELSSTQLSHTVGNLSKALVFYENFYYFLFSSGQVQRFHMMFSWLPAMKLVVEM